MEAGKGNSWINEGALDYIAKIAQNIFSIAGYITKGMSYGIEVLAYRRDNLDPVWIVIRVAIIYSGGLKQIPSGIRLFFHQSYKPYDQYRGWMKAKLYIDDDYGNHHWYVDPQKLVGKLEQAIQYMRENGIGGEDT